MGQVVGEEGCGIVATYLIFTSAKRSTAVIVTDNHVWISCKPSLEVWAYRCDENQETVLLGGMNANLSTRTDEQRTDIERSTTLVGRYPLLIQTYHFLHHLCEEFCAHLWHHDTTAGALQTCCVLFYTEDAHLPVWAAIGLQSLECLLAIVQAGSCHVQFQILVGADFYLAPFAVTIVTAYIVGGLHVTERQISPI